MKRCMGRRGKVNEAECLQGGIGNKADGRNRVGIFLIVFLVGKSIMKIEFVEYIFLVTRSE